MNSSKTLEYKLRELFLEYSPKQVYETTLQIFENDFTFYKTLFQKDTQSVKSEIATSPPLKQGRKKESKKIVVVRKPEEVQSLHLHPDEVDSEEITAKIDISTLLKSEGHDEDKTVFIAAKQKEREDETHQRLVSEGINPETLLTKENLKEWVEVKKYNFAYIARELVGLTQNQVRFAAKAFNIQSPITERRKRIIGAKIVSGK